MRKYYDEITRIAGNVVTVKAGGVGYDELAIIATAAGPSLAQVIRLEGDQVSLQVFALGFTEDPRAGWRHRPEGRRLTRCPVRGASARGASLIGASLRGASLRGAPGIIVAAPLLAEPLLAAPACSCAN